MIAAIPTGTLRRNPTRQEMSWVSAPPRISPTLVPIPASAP